MDAMHVSLETIFEVYPRIDGVPTEPLRRAVLKLQEVAVAQTRERMANFRIQYYSHLGMAPTPIPLETFEKNVKTILRQTYGIKGPVENAYNDLNYWAQRAYAAGHPSYSPKYQKAFGDFLMIVVTEGFVGKETTGTQIGNHSGKGLGGLGFGDD